MSFPGRREPAGGYFFFFLTHLPLRSLRPFLHFFFVATGVSVVAGACEGLRPFSAVLQGMAGGLVLTVAPWSWHGDLAPKAWAVLSGFGWAAGTVAVKYFQRDEKLDMLTLITWQMAIGVLGTRERRPDERRSEQQERYRASHVDSVPPTTITELRMPNPSSGAIGAAGSATQRSPSTMNAYT